MSEEVPSENTERSVSMLLLSRGKIGRRGYALWIAAVILCVALALGAFSSAMNPTGGGEPGLAVPLILIAIWLHICLVAARLRDAGYSAWWTIVPVIAPFVLVIFLTEYLEVSTAAWVVLAAGLFVCYVGPVFLPSRAKVS